MRGHVLKRGKTWSYVIEPPRREGDKRNQKWVSGFNTRREAEAALTTAKARVQGGAYVAPTRQTVGDYLDNDWLPSIRATIRPSTYESYARNVRLHIIPRIGGVRLSQLDAGALNALYADLATSGRAWGKPGGLAPRTVQYIHSILHRALKDAVRWDRLARNVADAADPPRATASTQREIHAWSSEDLNKFLATHRDDRMYALWRLLAMTGLRRGEALGLRWSDIDLEAGTLSVRQTLITIGDEIAYGTPKTSKGTRLVTLDPPERSQRSGRTRFAKPRRSWLWGRATSTQLWRSRRPKAAHCTPSG
jgi:integrase